MEIYLKIYKFTFLNDLNQNWVLLVVVEILNATFLEGDLVICVQNTIHVRILWLTFSSNRNWPQGSHLRFTRCYIYQNLCAFDKDTSNIYLLQWKIENNINSEWYKFIYINSAKSIMLPSHCFLKIFNDMKCLIM